MIKVTIHSTGNGVCSLSDKDGDGLTVTFEDATVQNAFLSWKSFRQLLALKSRQHERPKPAQSAGNGNLVAMPVK